MLNVRKQRAEPWENHLFEELMCKQNKEQGWPKMKVGLPGGRGEAGGSGAMETWEGDHLQRKRSMGPGWSRGREKWGAGAS